MSQPDSLDPGTSPWRRPLVVCLCGIGCVLYLAATLLPDVYRGIPRSIPVSAIEASCRPAPGLPSCEATVVRLNPGRFYVRTTDRASSLTVIVSDPVVSKKSRVLLLRSDRPGSLELYADSQDDHQRVTAADYEPSNGRQLLSVRESNVVWNRLTFTPRPLDGPIVLSELGFFATDAGLLRTSLQPFQSISQAGFYSTVAAAIALFVSALVVAVAWCAPASLHRAAPWLVAVLCAGISVIELGTLFSPYGSRDLRVLYAEELSVSGPGANLTGGLQEASRLVQGLGQTVAPGFVQWHRMPGYGLLCGLAAWLARTTDLIEIAAAVVLLQVLLYAAAVGLFVGAARRLFGVGLACLLGVLITLLPKQLGYTAVDSIAAPLSLLLLAALLGTMPNRDSAAIPFGSFFLVQLACAAWFVARNDVLPGWAVLSVALSAGRARRLLVPLVLAAAIALPWAAYKRQYRHEFNVLPTNTGEVLLLGLCEAPGAFPYECSDSGYFAWARHLGLNDPASQRTSNRAVSEVVRHWFTYPVHFALMLFVKLRRCLLDEAWPGFRTRLNLLYGSTIRDAGLFAWLLIPVALSIAHNYQRRRTCLLGWAVFLNMPVFFAMYSSGGRFYAPAGISLLVAAVPLLLDARFFARAAAKRWRTVVVLAGVAAFLLGGPHVEQWIRTHDAVHYWSPFLDPARSTLEFVAR